MRQKVLKGFEKYVIYDSGIIWSISKKCWMKPSITKDGYLQTVFINSFAINGYRRSYKIHRLVADAFVPNPNKLPEVNHKDGNKLNNHYSNLEWCTRSENIKHCYKLGFRSSKGVHNGNYKTGQYVTA